MSALFFKDLPIYYMRKFCPVRDAFDNLSNIVNLVEIVNSHQEKASLSHIDGFDLAIFTGNFNRALIRKDNGYFSMAIPFQITKEEERFFFNFDPINGEVGGLFLSIVRNAISASQLAHISCEDIILSISENFSLSIADSTKYCDAFFALLALDHGYFRFDDDPIGENGNLHPRFHFDFFYKNSSSIKIGMDNLADINCFYSLFDKLKPKMYLRK